MHIRNDNFNLYNVTWNKSCEEPRWQAHIDEIGCGRAKLSLHEANAMLDKAMRSLDEANGTAPF